jgi:hypothetical protein
MNVNADNLHHAVLKYRDEEEEDRFEYINVERVT